MTMFSSENGVKFSNWAGDRPLRSDGCITCNDQHVENTSRANAWDQSNGDEAVSLLEFARHPEHTRGRSVTLPRRAHARSWTSRRFTLAVAAQEYVWWWDFRHGVSAEAIAKRDGVSERRVRFGVRALKGSSALVPLRAPFGLLDSFLSFRSVRTRL